MRKKYLFIGLILALAVRSTSYLLYQETIANRISKNSILLEKNVEALARDETPPVTCGTKETQFRGDICPGHSHKIGFKGVEYSYSKIGFDTSYKKGKKGTFEECPEMGNTPYPVNDVKEFSCSIRKR